MSIVIIFLRVIRLNKLANANIGSRNDDDDDIGEIRGGGLKCDIFHNLSAARVYVSIYIRIYWRTNWKVSKNFSTAYVYTYLKNKQHCY